ncbi:MAG TPA: quinone oxidoreductase [Stellaceae bacterium]|jgi:NADPH2:quinone reductase|nr:quinone oxidoreductase [Stellaceae bacterium]
MRALQIRPEGLVYTEVPDPTIGPGDVLVRIEAAGLNYLDANAFLNAKPEDMPLPLGGEAGGRVVAVGAAVTDIAVGQAVCFRGARGAFAELVAMPAARVVPVPESVDLHLASGLIANGLSAHYLVASAYVVQQGDTVLVHAAAGGVGRMIARLAKNRGARVLGTVSSAAKAAAARQSGVDEAINYIESDFEAEVTRLTSGEGAHAVYDSVGATTFSKGLNLLRTRGTMVSFGETSGPVPLLDTRLLARNSLTLTRCGLMVYIATTEELRRRAADVFRWVQEGALTVHYHAEYPMAEAKRAIDALRNRETIGKLLLVP